MTAGRRARPARQRRSAELTCSPIRSCCESDWASTRRDRRMRLGNRRTSRAGTRPASRPRWRPAARPGPRRSRWSRPRTPAPGPLRPVLERPADRLVEQRLLRPEVVADRGEVGSGGGHQVASGGPGVPPFFQTAAGSPARASPARRLRTGCTGSGSRPRWWNARRPPARAVRRWTCGRRQGRAASDGPGRRGARGVHRDHRHHLRHAAQPADRHHGRRPAGR